MVDGGGDTDLPAPLGQARRAWAELGRDPDRTLTLAAAEVWTVELPFRRPVGTGVGVHTHRPLVLVHLRSHGPGGPVEGWGECAALADTTYDAEDVGRAAEALITRLLPGLVSPAPGRETPRPSGPGRPVLPAPSDLDPRGRARSAGPLAHAALEQAVVDAHLRAEGRSLADLLGVAGARVPVGAVTGTAAEPTGLVAAVDERVADGYGRVKLKIGPGHDVDHVAAVRAAHPGLVLQADANGAYAAGAGAGAGVGAADRLARLDPFGLACLEQPLGRDDLAGHATLAARLATPVCLDESLDGPARVMAALEAGACSVVCLKPARLGGLGATLDVLAETSRRGVPTWAGGMFEAGFGRSVLATVAALAMACGPEPGPAPGTGPAPWPWPWPWPGDLSAPSTYLTDDVAPALEVVRDPTSGFLAVTIPDDGSVGLARPPERSALERTAVRRATLAF